jgi:hypothetical protein
MPRLCVCVVAVCHQVVRLNCFCGHQYRVLPNSRSELDSECLTRLKTSDTTVPPTVH